MPGAIMFVDDRYELTRSIGGERAVPQYLKHDNKESDEFEEIDYKNW